MKYLKITFLAIILITSCKKGKVSNIEIKKSKEIEFPICISDSTYNAMGAYFFTTADGTIILNWSQSIDTLGTQILKYKEYDTKSKTFGKTTTIAPSKGMQAHHESMAKVGKTRDGVYYAIFRFKKPTPNNRFAGAIYYAISEDGRKKWSPKKKLITAKNATSQSFYDIVLLPDGELGMSWLDSRKVEKDKDGSSLYFARTRGKEGFVDIKPIAGSTCQCCRTDIFVDKDKQLQVGFRNIEEEGTSRFVKGQIRDMYRVISSDNGKTFSNKMPMGRDYWEIEGCPHTGPSFADTKDKLGVAWFTGAKTGSGIFFKDLSNLSAQKILVSNIGRHPQMIAMPNGKFLVVYEDTYSVGKESYNHIVLHTITNKGKETKQVISPYNTKNNHAILAKINDSSILVAWTNKDKKTSKIICKIIHF